MFQSTHPYRVWLQLLGYGRFDYQFQSTHPYRVWHMTSTFNAVTLQFQSTHPYRVWRFSPYGIGNMFRVSIHTPIQGVTGKIEYKVSDLQVSIHTPIQGVTLPTEDKRNEFFCFNPHTHTGCDDLCRFLSCCKLGFNPHTHTGCDLASSISKERVICFNPHTHTGCDIRLRLTVMRLGLFQSTHPYRVWLVIQL